MGPATPQETKLGPTIRKIASRDNPPRTSDPEMKFQKRLQWLKWLAATVIAIFLGGFAVAQHLGAFAKTVEVEAAIIEFREDHESDHEAMNIRVQSIENRTIEIYGEQRAAGARQRLINYRIELLLERPDATRRHSARDRRASEIRVRALERLVESQERAVRAIEADPFNE